MKTAQIKTEFKCQECGRKVRAKKIKCGYCQYSTYNDAGNFYFCEITGERF